MSVIYQALSSSVTMSNTSKIKLGNELLLIPSLCLGQMEVAACQAACSPFRDAEKGFMC